MHCKTVILIQYLNDSFSKMSYNPSGSFPNQNGVSSSSGLGIGPPPKGSLGHKETVLEEHSRIRNSSENLSFVDNKVPSMEENFSNYCSCTLRHYSVEQDARNLHDDINFKPSNSQGNVKLVNGDCKFCGGRVVKEVLKKRAPPPQPQPPPPPNNGFSFNQM